MAAHTFNTDLRSESQAGQSCVVRSCPRPHQKKKKKSTKQKTMIGIPGRNQKFNENLKASPMYKTCQLPTVI